MDHTDIKALRNSGRRSNTLIRSSDRRASAHKHPYSMLSRPRRVGSMAGANAYRIRLTTKNPMAGIAKKIRMFRTRLGDDT
jgi:hypothetical protein